MSTIFDYKQLMFFGDRYDPIEIGALSKYADRHYCFSIFVDLTFYLIGVNIKRIAINIDKVAIKINKVTIKIKRIAINIDKISIKIDMEIVER